MHDGQFSPGCEDWKEWKIVLGDPEESKKDTEANGNKDTEEMEVRLEIIDGDWIADLYDNDWYIGLEADISDMNGREFFVKFMEKSFDDHLKNEKG